MTTPRGEEAVRLVGTALNEFGVLTTMPVVLNITGIALDVVADVMNLEAGVTTLVYRWRPNMTAHEARTLLEVAVEALTATNPANPQE